jgi:uncharacterized membrane protein
VGFDRSARDFWVRIACAIVAVAGIAVTAYLVWERYHGNNPVCAIGGGCLTVQRSEWSTVAGVPVAILGLTAYVGMLGCALVPWSWAALASLFLSLLGVMLSGYLTYLELFTIHAICEYCVTSAAIVTVLFVLSIVRVLVMSPPADVRPV